MKPLIALNIAVRIIEKTIIFSIKKKSICKKRKVKCFERIFKFSEAESIVQEVNIPVWVFVNK